MDQIQLFDFDNVPVRVAVDETGAPWFVLADLCRILGIASKPSQVAARLASDERGVRLMDTPGGRQEMAVASEPGLWRVILRSDSPAAEPVRRWVTHDVLPAIRRTGSYQIAPVFDIPGSLPEALRLAADLAEQRDTARAEVAELEPRAEAFDAFLSAEGDMSVAQASQVLSRDHGIDIGQNRLFAYLETRGWIVRDAGRPRAAQHRVDRGYLRMRAQTYAHHRTGERTVAPPQVRVTPRGLEAIARMLAPVTSLQAVGS